MSGLQSIGIALGFLQRYVNPSQLKGLRNGNWSKIQNQNLGVCNNLDATVSKNLKLGFLKYDITIFRELQDFIENFSKEKEDENDVTLKIQILTSEHASKDKKQEKILYPIEEEESLSVMKGIDRFRNIPQVDGMNSYVLQHQNFQMISILRSSLKWDMKMKVRIQLIL